MCTFRLILFIGISFLSIQLSAQKRDTITTETGLKIIRLKPGNGINPKDGQTLKVFYRGVLRNGKEFDSNMGNKSPFKFKLGKKEVIPGWDEGFKLMSKGEKAILIVPAKLAYGKSGVKDPEDDRKYMIPPDSELLFEVELVDFR
jgi:FKBP-type peptidyl-prolyl cis-trans isomerase